MDKYFDEAARIIDNFVKDKVEGEFSLTGVDDKVKGRVKKSDTLWRVLFEYYLNLLGIAALGVGVGVMSFIITYVAFVLVLHISF